MTAEELKAIQLHRQHLTAPTELRPAVRDVLGVQAQFAGNALHALRIRCAAFDEAAAERELVRSWTVRGTMHVFDPTDLPLFLHEGRTRFLRPCDTTEADDRVSAERKRRFAETIVRSVEAGAGEREELRAACRAAGMTADEETSVFDPWGGLLRALCENGTLCQRAAGKKEFVRCPPFTPMAKDAAERELLRRYYAGFGPATVRDAAYFFGWTQKKVRSLLDALPVRQAECMGRAYFFLGDVPANAGIPDCRFLAGFDQLLMGYQKTESPYLPPEHLRGIFNRAGIVMPAVLLRGRVVGKWKRERSVLRVTPFEPLAARERKLVEREAQRLWGDTAVGFE